MFGRNRGESEIRQKRAQFMSNPLARRLSQVAFNAILDAINFRKSTDSLKLLGADVTIAINYWKSETCEITAFGVSRKIDLPHMSEADYRALTEAVGCIVADDVKEYLTNVLGIYNPKIGVYTEHGASIRAAVSVIYGSVDDEAGRIK